MLGHAGVDALGLYGVKPNEITHHRNGHCRIALQFAAKQELGRNYRRYMGLCADSALYAEIFRFAPGFRPAEFVHRTLPLELIRFLHNDSPLLPETFLNTIRPSGGESLLSTN